jgi:hypothetical protein
MTDEGLCIENFIGFCWALVCCIHNASLTWCLSSAREVAPEANRKSGPGTREKVRSKRINLEGNTHAQEINVSQLPV